MTAQLDFGTTSREKSCASCEVTTDEYSCDFTNSSGLLATCSEDGTAKIYAVNTLMVPICKLTGPTEHCDTRDEVVIRASVSGQPPPQLSWYVVFERVLFLIVSLTTIIPL